MANDTNQQKHFVLIHGACLGAWSWHKLKPLLESAGHRVTVFDLAAAGINMKAIQDVHSLHEYTEPLLEILASLPCDEKVILVGHSQGGFSLALATEKFPEKISVAVYLTAFMPDTKHQASYVLDQYTERIPEDNWLDTEFSSYGKPNQDLTSMLFGPKFLTFKLFQLCPVEDLELGKTLARPGSLFVGELSKAKNNYFSNEGFGSVKRVFIVCKDDQAIPVEFQRWMIESSGVKHVMEIEGADHMAMFSKSQEVCNCLSEIAHKYA